MDGCGIGRSGSRAFRWTEDDAGCGGARPRSGVDRRWRGRWDSSRAIDTTVTITPDTVLIDGFVTKPDASVGRGERRHEVIRLFDRETGTPGALIEHPDGEPFEGLGDAIAANDQFIITALSGKAQFGRDGELLVYDANTRKLLRRIKNPRDGYGTYFGGTGVAISGERILAAVPQTKDNASTAWVFSAKTGETLLTIPEPDMPDPALGKPRRTAFGRNLAMNSNHIAIMSNGRKGPGGLSARGIVYVFDARDGAVLHRLRSPGSQKASQFGSTLAMSDTLLYVGELEETGSIKWPSGIVHAFDLKSGKRLFSLADPGTPKTFEDVGADKEGWGFPADLSAEGRYLISGLPDWSGPKKKQGSLIIFDARTGKHLLTYGHATGEEYGRFGKAISANDGHLAVMQEIRNGGPGALQLILYRLGEDAE